MLADCSKFICFCFSFCPEKKKKKKGGKKAGGNLQIDKGYLSCGHHHAMVAGLAFLPQQGVCTLRLVCLTVRERGGGGGEGADLGIFSCSD